MSIISLYTKKAVTLITAIYGAGEGNRTLLSSLGSSHSTDELRPQDVHIVSYMYLYIQVKLVVMNIPIVVVVLYCYNNRGIK